jgi:hypothetical protein
MLGDGQAQLGQVKHLTDLDPRDRRARKRTAAATAPVGNVDNDLVGLGDLFQVRAWGARLLAGPAPATSATCRAGGLAQAIL